MICATSRPPRCSPLGCRLLWSRAGSVTPGSTTLNGYAHFMDAGDRAAAATMGTILKRAREVG